MGVIIPVGRETASVLSAGVAVARNGTKAGV